MPLMLSTTESASSVLVKRLEATVMVANTSVSKKVIARVFELVVDTNGLSPFKFNIVKDVFMDIL